MGPELPREECRPGHAASCAPAPVRALVRCSTRGESRLGMSLSAPASWGRWRTCSQRNHGGSSAARWLDPGAVLAVLILVHPAANLQTAGLCPPSPPARAQHRVAGLRLVLTSIRVCVGTLLPGRFPSLPSAALQPPPFAPYLAAGSEAGVAHGKAADAGRMCRHTHGGCIS